MWPLLCQHIDSAISRRSHPKFPSTKTRQREPKRTSEWLRFQMALCAVVGSPALSAQMAGCPEARPDRTRRLPARTPDHAIARSRVQRAHRPATVIGCRTAIRVATHGRRLGGGAALARRVDCSQRPRRPADVVRPRRRGVRGRSTGRGGVGPTGFDDGRGEEFQVPARLATSAPGANTISAPSRRTGTGAADPPGRRAGPGRRRRPVPRRARRHRRARRRPPPPDLRLAGSQGVRVVNGGYEDAERTSAPLSLLDCDPDVAAGHLP
jgi:hypothetical protein